MAGYHQPIPSAVYQRIPELIAEVGHDVTYVEVASFGEDGGVLYGIILRHSPKVVIVKDKRSSNYLRASQVEHILDAEGNTTETYTPTAGVRLGDVGRSVTGFPTMTEEEYEALKKKAYEEQMSYERGRSDAHS